MNDSELATCHWGHSEAWARHALERRRKRGDLNASMMFHEDCGQWHVLTGEGDLV